MFVFFDISREERLRVEARAEVDAWGWNGEEWDYLTKTAWRKLGWLVADDYTLQYDEDTGRLLYSSYQVVPATQRLWKKILGRVPRRTTDAELARKTTE